METNNILKEYASMCECLTRNLTYKLIDIRIKHPKLFERNSIYCRYLLNRSWECKLLKQTPFQYKNRLEFIERVDPNQINIDLLTKYYPKWGKALERFLEDNVLIVDDQEITPNDLFGYKDVPFRDLLLLAMGVDLGKSIMINSWAVYNKTQKGLDIQALFIKTYRQLTLYLYKLEIPYTTEQLLSKQYEFVKNDVVKSRGYRHLDKLYHQEIKAFIEGFLDPLTVNDCNYSFIYNDREVDVDFVPFNYDVSRARHSNGAVSNLVSSTRATKRREYIPPHSVHHISGLFDYIAHRYDGKSIPAKVVFVPKDSRGPRMIAMEPDYLGVPQSYIQEMLYDRLNDYGIDLTNQDNNRFMALQSSGNRKFATIDLKNASDNILTEHILDLFPRYWSDLLLSLRSSHIELTDGHIHTARCFALMGNKLTFPIQTIIFLAIASVAARLTRSSKSVLVYGDDIIVPTKAYNKTLAILESWGFDVNLSKSFNTGFFRESCGIFAFAGNNVNCIYRRKVELTAEHINELSKESIIVPHNFFNLQGVEGAASIRASGSLLKGLPIRWNDSLHRVEVKLYVSRAQRVFDNSTDDRFYLDEWLRLYMGDTKQIETPRVIRRYTEIPVMEDTYVELPISNIPKVICYATLIQSICKEYCTDDDLSWLNLSANEHIIMGDISVLYSEFKPARIAQNNKIEKGNITMKNHNYEFIKGLSVLNKKVDVILASFKLKAEMEKKKAVNTNSKQKNSKPHRKGDNSNGGTQNVK